MADVLELEIVTPEHLVEKDTVEEIQIPGKNGYLGILPGHAPLITELGVGEITYKADGMDYHVAVAWGFAEVLPDRVTVLAETAERAEDIDVERARKSKQRAEERLRSAGAGGEVDYQRALTALQRADSRLDVAQKKR
jgi:F-type H+-transporting ATPase subunit epsilon